MEDEEQTVRLKANFIISAFGSGLSDAEGFFFFFLTYCKHAYMYLPVLQSGKLDRECYIYM